MVSYQYRPLSPKDEEIRVIQLHEGKHGDQVRISILHMAFCPSTYTESRHAPTAGTAASTNSMPDSWIMSRTLEGRIIYYRESVDGKLHTSWVRPDVADNLESVESAHSLQTERVAFEAVSYTWGTVKTPIEIQVIAADDVPLQPPQTMKVGPNLFTMLRYLRKQKASRLLWIDAICINQEDLVERGEQVARMHHIYAFANRVIIWLGEATQDSNLALKMLEHSGKQLEYTESGFYLPSPECAGTERFWYKENLLSTETWTAIANLMQRPYFERLWILQEIQLANDESIVQCGQSTILWYHLRRAFLHCYYSTAGLPQFSTPLLKTKIDHLYRLSNDLKALDSGQLFYMASKCECSDPRDKVFAILGLLPRKFACNIDLRYGIPIQKVYMQTFLAFVNTTRRLTLLGSQSCSNAMPDWPSWVPSFGNLENERMVSFYNFASSLTAAQAIFQAPNKLHVVGVFLDTVSATGETITDDLRLNYERAKKLRSEVGNESFFANGAQFLEACSWVLTLGDLRDRWVDLDVIPSLEEMSDFISGRSDTAAGMPDITERYKHWYHILVTNLGSEKLFLTDQGRVGCGPTTAQPGDKLSILLGYSHPVLLRPAIGSKTSGTYVVIGPTYVHGLMDGEGILGPLPTPWKLVVRNPGQLQTSYSVVAVNPSFYNAETAEYQSQDPRLVQRDKQWELVEKNDEARLGTCVQHYRHIKSGEIINSDPNLALEMLKAQNVPFNTIVLT